jgi:hypothetical protein
MPEISYGNIKQVSELIVRDLNLESEISIVEIKHLDELKEKLEKIVAYLLDNDFERLLNAMYRLDINEEKFKLAISGLSGDSISKEITELIINREIKKLKTRVKYRGS